MCRVSWLNTTRWAFIGSILWLLAACSGNSGKPVIVSGNARFEFLTASLLRLEYSSSGRFIDAPSAVVQKRDWPQMRVRRKEEGGWLIASTDAMTLKYRVGSGPFTATNLTVSWKKASGDTKVWHPGDKDPLNLGGMPYSLDNVSEENLPVGRSDIETPVNDTIPGIDVLLTEAKPGLLSRSGYALIDDSRTPVWNAARSWIEPRAQANSQDWYLFTYDSDYGLVLREYAELCGAVPMVPRYVLGPMVTDLNFEYFPGSEQALRPQFQQYNEQRLEEELSRLRSNQIPFDTLILDFAWHNYGWDGGYDWSPLIPHPQQFLDWLHARSIKLSLNDHPGYANTDESILSFSDSHAPKVLKELGGAAAPQSAFNLDLGSWQFAADPHETGMTQQWFATGARAHWKPIRIGLPWQEQGYANLSGIGWYRTSVRLPPKLPSKLYLYVGEVEKSYRIFVNGKEASHSQIHWPRRLTYTDITPYVTPGRTNELVLRVQSGVQRGGVLLGPVALRDVQPPERIYFDLSNQHQAQVFMRELHEPLMRQGVNFWWVDGGSGAADMPGLNKQLWTNKVFYDYTQQQSGQRGFILGRYGDWGSERYPAFFTGDTYSQWPVLAYEIAFTARGGNVLMDYISHDIGGFHGARIDFDLYARWIEFGTFSPILRMHSAHANPLEGNLRMPWIYGDEGVALMRKYFSLRTQLIPYFYTYSWRAHRDAIPILQPLYFKDPGSEESYRHSHEYFFGDELLVAPVYEPSGEQSIYLPPGQWLDFFSGQPQAGGTSFTKHYEVDEIPVFVRDGALIPEQAVSEYSDAKPPDPLIINVYGSAAGRFDLYEDDGISLGYQKGDYALTPLVYNTTRDGVHHLTIDATKGSYAGQEPGRAYILRLHGVDKAISVSAAGQELGPGTYDATQSMSEVGLPKRSIRDKLEITWH